MSDQNKPESQASDRQTGKPPTEKGEQGTQGKQRAQGEQRAPGEEATQSEKGTQASGPTPKRLIKIGSQRPGHEIKPPEPNKPPSLDDSLVTEAPVSATPATPAPATPAPPAMTSPNVMPAAENRDDRPLPPVLGGNRDVSKESRGTGESGSEASVEVALSPRADIEVTSASFPAPRIRKLSDDVQREVDDALSGVSMEELLGGGTSTADEEIKIDSKCSATVVKVDREYLFFSLPGRHEGAIGIRHFDEIPEVGTTMTVMVTGFKPDERMYELSVPGASVAVSDWSDIEEGAVVEATVTGHNTGGLECKVGGIAGFIPISQIALYRVEDCSEFVDQKLRCVITEANPSRGNLVLSHRDLLEREREAAREELMKSLDVGQEHEGVVRKIMDFGAFVDIGGVDGLVHISKLSWDRVKHPSDVLTEGEKVKIKIDKIDRETGKLSFSYRDLIESPWENAESKYPANAIVQGTVSKIMPFGAFVRIAAGVEGLVHISEVAHHRVTRVDNVVQEGHEVTVKILSVDQDAQKISLSIKGAQVAPSSAKTTDTEDENEPPPPPLPKSNKPLKGGLNKPTGGEGVGLTW